MTIRVKPLPCTDRERLYDIALFANTAAPERQMAAALCATCPTPCGQKITTDPVPECPEPSYGCYLAHKKRGEEAPEGCKAAKREYDRERYARNPRKARGPQRAYEARQRAARAAA